jgi:CheY-like chemotaxis protein
MPALLLTDSTVKGLGAPSLDLVAWIRAQPSINRLPVICVTGSNNPEIFRQFLRLGVISHSKTPDMVEIARTVKIALAARPDDDSAYCA